MKFVQANGKALNKKEEVKMYVYNSLQLSKIFQLRKLEMRLILLSRL